MSDPFIVEVPIKPAFVLGISTKEKMLFFKQLSLLLRADMPLLQALQMLSVQAHGRSRYLCVSHAQDVARGKSLSWSMAQQKGIYGPLCIQLVAIGEYAGNLSETLEYAAIDLKKSDVLHKKILGALIYPAIVMIATLSIALVLTLVIFPKIVPLFRGLHVDLPLSTRVLMAVSVFLMQWWWAVVGAAILLSITAYVSVRYFERARAARDAVLLKIPVFGSLTQKYYVARICRILGTLLHTNTPCFNALSICASGVDHSGYRNELVRIVHEISRGQALSAHLHNETFFPPLVAQMVSVGEQTGSLATTFIYLSETYEEEIDDLTRDLSTMLEPVLMIIMGSLVGFIAISIITPIYSITQHMSSMH